MTMQGNKYFIEKIYYFLKGRTTNTFLRLFRYKFVGGFAFLVDFRSLYILTEYFNIHYFVSAGIAFLIGRNVIHKYNNQYNSMLTAIKEINNIISAEK